MKANDMSCRIFILYDEIKFPDLFPAFIRVANVGMELTVV